MNITNAKYYKSGNDSNINIKATIDGEELYIPIHPANRHYAAIIEWAKEDSNEIAAAD